MCIILATFLTTVGWLTWNSAHPTICEFHPVPYPSSNPVAVDPMCPYLARDETPWDGVWGMKEIALAWLPASAAYFIAPIWWGLTQFPGMPAGRFPWDVRELPEGELPPLDCGLLPAQIALRGDVKTLTAEDVSKLLAEGDKFCPICHEDYNVGDKMREIKCGHILHQECIDRWLAMKDTCPLTNLPTEECAAKKAKKKADALIQRLQPCMPEAEALVVQIQAEVETDNEPSSPDQPLI